MQQSLVVFVLFESEYVVKDLKLLRAKRFVKHVVDYVLLTVQWYKYWQKCEQRGMPPNCLMF